MKLVAGIAISLLAASTALAHEGFLPAPYQVDGVLRFRSDHYRENDGLTLRAPLIAVDLGTAAGKPHPGSDSFRVMTFVGTGGGASGTLYDIRKTCDYLCGDDGEACHYVALYSLNTPLEALGTPLMALAGNRDLTAFRDLRPITPASGPAPRLTPGRGFAPPVWSPYASEDPTYRIGGWSPQPRTLRLEQRYGDGKIITTDAPDCEFREAEGLTFARCNGLALILDGSDVLLLSFPDYNMAAAEAIARFAAGGRTYLVVRLGLKAQTVFGLLTKTPEGWRARFRPRDYALLC
jgi:hypothetical protein